ncbi:MAG: hypothetical protein J6P16_05610 [Eubacterium sp.]|nr:hypothetical protein [Eubacterium sp.]
MKEIRIWKRVLAGALVMVMAFMLPAVHVQGASKQTLYIKNFVLFSKPEGVIEDAMDWCEEKGENWHVVPGDLNEGADSDLKDKVGVFLCYETTKDKKEAVTDIAVMNEKGNYSESSYKRMLEEQKQVYKDMVNDLKAMLGEYRENVRKNVPTAVQAKKLLNGYIETDSNTRMGDLLMTVDDEKLATILMQANGQVVMFVEQQLANACDTSDRTWLDRLSALGSDSQGYDTLLKKATKACNGDEDRAVKLLDANYRDAAGELLDSYFDVKSHISHMLSTEERYGLDKMSEEEKNKWIESHRGDPEGDSYFLEVAASKILHSYTYYNCPLFLYFTSKDDAFDGDGIRNLYPLAASLTDGQRAALRESTSLFSMIVAAAGSTVQDGLKKGKGAEITNENSAEAIKTAESLDEAVNELENTKEPVSIYEGVDREIFADGGVAVTSAAEKYKTDDNGTWYKALMDKAADDENYERLTLYLTAGTLGCAVASGVIAWGSSVFSGDIVRKGFEVAKANRAFSIDDKLAGMVLDDNFQLKRVFSSSSVKMTEEYTIKGIKNIASGKITDSGYTVEQAQTALSEFHKIGLGQGSNRIWSGILTGLKWGFAIACILLAAADIALTVYKLYYYYNKKQLPIPHHMVDITYNSARNTEFISYKNVKNQDGESGDVNGNSGLQWLALYETHDERAGEPILAPENGNAYGILVLHGKTTPESDEYKPLHMFGTPNAAQNLTFADGESGYSYNDKKNGTYLFFRRDDGAPVVDDSAVSENKEKKSESNSTAKDQTAISTGAAASATEGQTGTAATGGVIIAAAGIGFAAGVVVCLCAVRFSRRKKGSIQ